MPAKALSRCPWPIDDKLMIEYHDTEWGVPVHDDKKHFEFVGAPEIGRLVIGRVTQTF